jgi:hypothetical protein
MHMRKFTGLIFLHRGKFFNSSGEADPRHRNYSCTADFDKTKIKFEAIV